MRRTQIQLPDETFVRAKKLCEAREVSLAELAISEFILAEFYGLLRNSSVLQHPLSADEAVEIYRRHPRWRLIGLPTESRPLHDALWQKARATAFAFRQLYDTRSALTMTAQGVTEFATANVKDFERLGFRRVWNPLGFASAGEAEKAPANQHQQQG